MRSLNEILIYLLVIAALSNSVAARPIDNTIYDTDGAEPSRPHIQTAQLPNPEGLPIFLPNPPPASIQHIGMLYRGPSGSMPPEPSCFPLGTDPSHNNLDGVVTVCNTYLHYTSPKGRESLLAPNIWNNPPPEGPPPSYTRPPSYHDSQNSTRISLPTATDLPPMYAEMVRGQL
ncbi:hypothetical protein B0J17DRAFT_674247 [Rhizoctonia solani]|nr:hypothetical protein B0J17DRAFT_674247 [Rhizoctonia solani]